MKKLSIPLLLSVVIFAACGKKDAANPNGPALGVVPPQPTIPAPSTGADFLSWCQQQLGAYDSAQQTCKMQQNIQFGYNKYMGAIHLGLTVYANDKIFVSTSKAADVVIRGANSQAETHPANAEFTAQTQGALFVERDDTKSYSVKSIRITRCYNSNQQAVTCL